MDTYRDIIDHPHYQSKTRPHMSMQNRAAQFAPFAALTGYDDEVKETARLTDKRVELDESEIALLNDKLQYISMCLDERPRVSVTYFVKDASKEGGSYETVTGAVQKIDALFSHIIMDDGTMVPINDIYSVDL